jgi:hypothetical protein
MDLMRCLPHGQVVAAAGTVGELIDGAAKVDCYLPPRAARQTAVARQEEDRACGRRRATTYKMAKHFLASRIGDLPLR